MWIRTIVLSLTGLMAILNTPIAMAQQADDTGGRRGGRGAAQSATQESPTVRCFNITRSHPTKIADYIGQLYGRGRVVDMPAIGKVLFMGTEHEIAQVETLLQQIDIPEMDTQSDPELTIVPIQHRRAKDVLANIQPILSGLPDDVMRITADDTRSSIIMLSRSSKARTAVKEMIAGLDTPTERVAVEFAFFRADLNSTANAPAIPEDLQEVAAELSRFGQVTLLGRLFADATEGARFKVEGHVGADVDARIEGRIDAATKGEPIPIDINAEARVKVTIRTDNSTTYQEGKFSVSTSVLANAGVFFVIGGSPAGLAEGQSVMLAVRVKQ